MAKIDLKFLDCIDKDNTISVKNHLCEYGTIHSNSETIQTIFIELIFEGNEVYIDLDIPTAIKFAKTLRTEINKAKEGLHNG